MRLLLATALLAALAGSAEAQTSCSLLSTCPNASTPLNGGEYLYILQGGISKKITTSNFISATTGNLLSLNNLWTGTNTFNGLVTFNAGTVPAIVSLSANNIFTGNNTFDGTTTFNGPVNGINFPLMSVLNFLSTAQVTDVQANTCTLDVSAAINAGIGANPGVFIFPPGTYCVSSPIIINTNQTFMGSNRGASVIKALGATATTLLQTANFSSLLGTNTVGGPNHFEIDNLEFNGNALYPYNGAGGTCTGTGVSGGTTNNINIYGYNFIVHGVSTYNASNYGWFSQWATSATVPVPGSSDGGGMEAHTYNLQAFCNNNYGIEWQGPHDSILTDTLAMVNGLGGMALATSATYDGGAVLNTIHAYGNCNGPGIYTNGASGHDIGVFGSNIQGESNGNAHCGAANANSFGVFIDQYSGFSFNGVITYLNAQSGYNTTASNGKVNGLETFSNGYDGLAIASPAVNDQFTSVTAFGNANVGIASTGSGIQFGTTLSGGNTVANYSLPLPTLSACGTSPFMVGGSTDTSGTFQVGSGSITACTLNWTFTRANAPVCTLTGSGSYYLEIPSGQPTKTGLAFTSSATMGGTMVSYICTFS